MAQQEILNTPVNALDSDVPILGRIGSLQTRLARTITEVQAAQALRYDIFYGEMGGTTNVDNLQNRRDEDRFDSHCDHLLVIDTKHDRQQIVGTYRMMMPSQAEQAGGFYTQSEFDLQPLFSSNADARVLELGRSCILPHLPQQTNHGIVVAWDLGLMRWHGRLTSCSDVLRLGESIRMQYQMHFRGWAKMLR